MFYSTVAGRSVAVGHETDLSESVENESVTRDLRAHSQAYRMSVRDKGARLGIEILNVVITLLRSSISCGGCSRGRSPARLRLSQPSCTSIRSHPLLLVVKSELYH